MAQGELDFRLEVSGGDELSSLVRAFNTMTQDLKEARTRALKTSRELMESYAEIKQRRRYMEIILQNVNAGIISFDRNGIIRTMNRAAESILKMSAASIIGKPYKMMLTQDQFQEFEEIRKDLARSAKGTIQRPVKMVVDEKELSLLVNFTLLRDNENRSLGIVIVFEDLTELEKIQRLAAWREVARRIAHEVKNPLTPIQLSAQRLRKRYLRALDEDTGAVLDKCTNTIIDQVEELKHLVNEFSNFARMPAPRLVPTRLEELARKVLVMYGEGHPSFEFKLDSEENLPEVFLDPDQVKRALINLLDNAVAALSSGGKITVRIGHQSSSSEIFISVIDTGTGIPHEERHRLFEPDFSRRPGGTGLGLAIVNSIMSDHNGRIEVEDNIPNGSKFTLFFPIDQAD
ncbi:MAG TPA: PAS domain S-box protein [Thermodesulfobacteriaceae bacterium]|nr:PAS domain S-box protein [Thermodesulfobacteriaceae bacterium]